MNIRIAESPDFSPRALEILKQAGGSVLVDTGALETLPQRVREGEGLIVRFGLRWDRRVLESMARPRFIAVPATGTDHIDLAAARELGIPVYSLAGHPGLREITATPEHAFGLMLALLRHTVSAHRHVLKGGWNREPFFGRQVKDLSLGVVGLGRTGSAFAAMATAFGARVLYHDPFVANPAYESRPTLAELAADSDVLCLHAVLNKSTHHLVGKTVLEALRPGSWLINTARGALVDEAALLSALENGHLAGAALDVLDAEPPTGQPLSGPLLDYARTHDNLLLTPHIAGATLDSIDAAEVLLADLLVSSFGATL